MDPFYCNVNLTDVLKSKKKGREDDTGGERDKMNIIIFLKLYLYSKLNLLKTNFKIKRGGQSCGVAGKSPNLPCQHPMVWVMFHTSACRDPFYSTIFGKGFPGSMD